MTAHRPTLLFGSYSHKGPRETNEDTVLSIGLADGRRLVAVADGMGGLTKGELAGKTALGALYRHLNEGVGLKEAMAEANAAVHKEAKGQEMGTTLVAAVLSGAAAEIANVGDSRAYHLDPLGLVQVTRDHTLGEEAIQNGTVTEEEMASSPLAGALTRYLGSGERVEADLFGPVEIHEGGWLLLCSDGLYKVFSDEELESRLTSEVDPEDAARGLVDGALERETSDNVSAVLVFRSEEEDEGPIPTAATETPSAPWNPEKYISKSRPMRKKKKWGPLALRIFLILIPLLIGLVLALRWWF